jgi:hypothetical protein
VSLDCTDDKPTTCRGSGSVIMQESTITVFTASARSWALPRIDLLVASGDPSGEKSTLDRLGVPSPTLPSSSSPLRSFNSANRLLPWAGVFCVLLLAKLAGESLPVGGVLAKKSKLPFGVGLRELPGLVLGRNRGVECCSGVLMSRSSSYSSADVDAVLSYES